MKTHNSIQTFLSCHNKNTCVLHGHQLVYYNTYNYNTCINRWVHFLEIFNLGHTNIEFSFSSSLTPFSRKAYFRIGNVYSCSRKKSDSKIYVHNLRCLCWVTDFLVKVTWISISSVFYHIILSKQSRGGFRNFFIGIQNNGYFKPFL